MLVNGVDFRDAAPVKQAETSQVVKADAPMPEMQKAESPTIEAVTGRNTGMGNKEQGNKETGVATERQIEKAVSQANQRISRQENTNCEFSVHKGTNRVSIRIVDSDTQEVIREIPPEKSLDMLQKMWELAGILVDKKL